MERISATYLIETPLPVEKAAAVLAGEQSSGTFVAVPGETEELKNRFAARIEKLRRKKRSANLPCPGVVPSPVSFNALKLSFHGRLKT